MIPVEDYHQLKFRFTDPIQDNYEVVRPIVLFAQTVSERSRQTGIDRTVVGEKARRFIERGMLGLQDQRIGHSGRKSKEYPQAVAEYIFYLKQIYPPIHYREIVRIIKRKFDYTTNHVTVKNFLDRYAVPVQLKLDFPDYHQIEDPYQARWLVVKMWSEGWNKKSIAGCLDLSQRHVGRIIDNFQQNGFAALEDKRTQRPPNHPANQLTLPFLKEILDIQQEYPRAGRFRVHGLFEYNTGKEPPSESTVGRAMAINREFHGAPGPWFSRKDDQEEPETEPKYLPYRPDYRHHLWYIDIRYLVQLEGHWVYSICIIEGYSRTILAGMATDHQDLTVILQILFAALNEYGCPDSIVSDNGSVFKAHRYQTILDVLQIDPKYIEKGKPWENLIESQFKIQLRLADYKFEQAHTLTEIQDRHAEFIQTFNYTPHWEHRFREDGRRSPAQVLSWVRGRMVNPNELLNLFQQVHFSRVVNRFGFVSVLRFYLYAEQGLSRQRVSVWIYEGSLHIEYQDTMLAQYQVDYDEQQKRLEDISQPTVYQTPFASPQMVLFELDDEQWLKIRRRSYLKRQKRITQIAEQLALFRLDVAVWVLLYFGGYELMGFFFPNSGHVL